jgi:hypothetical protein
VYLVGFTILIYYDAWSTKRTYKHFQLQIFGEVPPDDDHLRPKRVEFQKTNCYIVNVVVICSDGSTTVRNTARDNVTSSVNVWVRILCSGGRQTET